MSVCPPPAIAISCVAEGTNVAVTESLTPDGVRARTRSVAREPGARSTPNRLIRASAESLVLQATKNCVTGTPAVNPNTWKRSESLTPTNAVRGWIAMLSAAGPM